MKRLLTIACLLLLASSVSPRYSSGLMVELNPASIIRQEPMLLRHSAIPVVEPRVQRVPLGSFHETKDDLGATSEASHGNAKSENAPESHLADAIYRLLQVKDIIAPMKPGKSCIVKK